MKFKLLRIMALCALMALPSMAAAITLSSGTLGLTLLTDGTGTTVFAVDVRGNAIFDIADPGPIGQIAITDLTPFGFPPPPAPNTSLTVANSTLSEAGGISFSDPRFGGVGYLLTGTYNFVTNPITDPALAAFAASSPMTFGFFFVDSTPQQDGTVVSTWSLASVESDVPEPLTTTMFGIGLLGLGLVARRRR